MLFIHLIRFVKGVVGFTLSGGFIERFLNLCTRAGIPVFDTHRTAQGLEARTTARGYRKMRPIAKKTGVRLRMSEKSGLPFWLIRYRKRVGFLIGLGFFVLFLGVMSRFIWNIELSGNETLSDEYLLENLKACGIREGAYIGDIDVTQAQREMLLLTPELSWIAINLRASTADVEIREREMPPEMIDTETPCNVVAGRTGQIVRMVVYDGQPVLREGDTVQEGELIVSAYMEGIKNKERGHLVHARAEVIAEFVEDVSIRVPLAEEVREPMGETVKKHSLTLFGLRIPLYLTGAPKGPSDCRTRTVQPIVMGLKLPLMLRTDTYQPLRIEQLTLTEDEAREEAMQQLWQYEEDFSSIGEIVGKEAKGEVSGGAYVLNARFTLRQDIARLKEIEVVEEGASAEKQDGPRP